MKLATLTAYIWSGWPRGVVCIEQDHVGHIIGKYTTGKSKALRNDPLPLCDDWSEAVITQDMWQNEVNNSLRMEPTQSTNYLPMCGQPEIPQSVLNSKTFKHAWAQFQALNHLPDHQRMVAEIAYLREVVHTVLGVHLTSLRERRKAAAVSVSAEKSLVWTLARVLAVWPYITFGNVRLEAAYVTQGKDNGLIAHYEWEGKVNPWPLEDVPKELLTQADDWLEAGKPRQIVKEQWVSAVSARIKKGKAREELLHKQLQAQSAPDTPVDTSSVEALLAHGAHIRQLAMQASGHVAAPEEPAPPTDTAFEFDATKVDKYGDPI